MPKKSSAFQTPYIFQELVSANIKTIYIYLKHLKFLHSQLNKSKDRENGRKIPTGSPRIPPSSGDGGAEKRRRIRQKLPVGAGDEEEEENEMLHVHRGVRSVPSGRDPPLLPHGDAREDAKGEAGRHPGDWRQRRRRQVERSSVSEEHQFRTVQVRKQLGHC